MKNSQLTGRAGLLQVLAVVLLLVGYGPAFAATGIPGSKLPAACRTQCITPYGSVLGVADGVTAYSNCSSQCVDRQPMQVNGVFTGIKWQCVEYARRWLLRHKGAVFASVNVAADIWTKIHYLQRVDHKGRIALQNYPNGSRRAPSVGDLLIYARAYLGTGHVAVITHVNLASHVLEVAEQNYLNTKYAGNFSRKITVIDRNHRYWVLDPYVLGWKHAVE